MKIVDVKGLMFTGSPFILRKSTITIRVETTGKHSTISFSDDNLGIMLEVPVTSEVKDLLKSI